MGNHPPTLQTINPKHEVEALPLFGVFQNKPNGKLPTLNFWVLDHDLKSPACVWICQPGLSEVPLCYVAGCGRLTAHQDFMGLCL